MNPVENENLDLLLCRYLDGELSRREQRKLEERVEQDAGLREELRLLASLDGQLAAMAEDVPAGADLDRQRAEIVSSVERRALLAPARRRLVFRPVVWGSLAAAAVLVIVASVAMRQFGEPEAAQATVSMDLMPVAAASLDQAVVVVDIRPALGTQPIPEEASELPGGSAVAASVGQDRAAAAADAAGRGEDAYAMY
jgi:hypothetical protein